MALTVDVRMMIVEAGIVANCVSGNAAGATLSNRIATEAAVAWDKLATDVVVSFSPFEAGLVLDGLSRSQDNLTGDIGTRLLNAVNKLMNDNNVEPLPSDSPIIGEQPIGDSAPQGAEQTSDQDDAAVLEAPTQSSDAGDSASADATNADADQPAQSDAQIENEGG